MTRKRIIPFFVPHLGCPHNCVFCNQRTISGKEHAVTPEEVAETLKPYRGQDVEVAFYGGSFTAIPKQDQKALLAAARGFPIRLSTRPDAIDGPELDLLASYGVGTIELGAQSMDEEVLARSGRGHSPDDVCRASERIRDRGFSLGLQMMTGLPGDSREKSIATAKKIISLSPDFVRIYPTVVVADTPLCRMYKEGTYQEHSVEEAINWCSAIVPLFDEARIPIIRLGLNPTDDLSGGEAVAGAYHPALGELVRSRIWREKLERQLSGILEKDPSLKEVTLPVPANAVSQAIGQHRCNADYLKDKYHLQKVKILGYN